MEKLEKLYTNGNNRIIEIDYIKAFCILAMIMVHCYGIFYPNGDSNTSAQLNILNALIGATSFMFCMGFTSNIKHNAVPKFDIFRGIGLLSVGLLLNILRSPVVMLIYVKTKGFDYYCQGLMAAVEVDILEFAGLAFILLGILRHLKVKPWGIFAVSLVMGAIGTIFRYTDTGNPVWNAILAFFIGSKGGSFFPLLHMFVFVAAGNLYMEYYTRIENYVKFYKWFLPLSAGLTAIYVTLASFKIGPFQVMSEIPHAWLNPIDAIGCVISTSTYMGVMWLLAELVRKMEHILAVQRKTENQVMASGLRFHPLTYLAKNINTLYCIHWVLLMFIKYWFMDVFKILPYPKTDIAVFAYMLTILFVTIGLSEFYKKFLRDRVHAFLGKAPLVWVALPFILSIICVALAVTHGITEIPCFLNGYTVGGVSYR